MPPGTDRNARRATVEDYDSLDDDSYVEVPRHTDESPIQYNISTGSPRVMPESPSLRDDLEPRYEPSDHHHFDMAPSSETYSDASTPRAAQYPMGGYSGRDMIRHPVHMNGTMSRTDSVESRDLDDYSDGRKHPAFRQITSQVRSHLPLTHPLLTKSDRSIRNQASLTEREMRRLNPREIIHIQFLEVIWRYHQEQGMPH